MLHIENNDVRKLLYQGCFGLEKESLRITPEGFLSHTPHPFPDDPHIVRDFCENQTEINTSVHHSAEGVVRELSERTEQIQKTLAELPEAELLWPFSNPPYIRSEEDIPIAQFKGAESGNTAYRNYLSDRYGRYVMTLSGIHFNYSFSEELLRAEFACRYDTDFANFRDQFYLELAEKAARFGWIVTAVTAASPVADRSFLEKGLFGGSFFTGMSSIRCSESGYWNFFVPVFRYSDIASYADGIQAYVDNGYLAAPRELYYPIRLKPAGKNSLSSLKGGGVNHIELRMVDLNPLEPAGINLLDVKFIQLFLIWLAAMPPRPMSEREQVYSVQNFKRAAHYDLRTVSIENLSGQSVSFADEGKNMIEAMQKFYKDAPEEVQQILEFDRQKFIVPETRYAWILRKEYADDFVKKGLELAKERQVS